MHCSRQPLGNRNKTKIKQNKKPTGRAEEEEEEGSPNSSTARQQEDKRADGADSPSWGGGEQYKTGVVGTDCGGCGRADEWGGWGGGADPPPHRKVTGGDCRSVSRGSDRGTDNGPLL